MAAYVFTVDEVLVHNCKSKGDHNDSDWLHIDIVNGEATIPEGLFQIGANIHAGDPPLKGPWLVGPVHISEDDRVIVSLLIENKSHTDAAKQEVEAIIIGAAILTGIAGVASAEASAVDFDAEAVADAVAAAVTGITGTIWATFVGDSDPNCNGEVCHQMFTYDRGDLSKKGTHTLETELSGPSTDNCGNPPHTKITYSVRVWTLKQAIIVKQAQRGIDIGKGTISLRSITPAVNSVKSYMGI